MNKLAHASFHPVDSTPHQKKVVFIIGQLGYGGAERQLYYYLTNHDRKRFTPSVIVLNSRKPHTYEEAIRDQGIEVIQIPENCQGLFRRMLAITRAIREIAPDIVHSWGFYTNPYASICGFLCGVKVRLGSLRSVPERMERLDMHPIHRWFAYRMIRGLTVNSRSAVDQLMRMGYPNRKTFLVENSVLVSPQHRAKFKWKKNILISEGIPENHQFIGTIGNHRKVKNQEMLIKASAILMREFPGLRCLIAGRQSAVEPEVLNELQLQVEKLNLSDRIIFPGFIDDVRELLRQLDIFCLTSLHEGMPNVVLEAMAEGCPVVSTPVGDVPYLIEHGRNGLLVKHDDPQGLAAEINKLLKDPKLAEKIGSAGRVTVEKHFGPAQMARTLEQIYKDLLRDKSFPGRENDSVQQL